MESTRLLSNIREIQETSDGMSRNSLRYDCVAESARYEFMANDVRDEWRDEDDSGIAYGSQQCRPSIMPFREHVRKYFNPDGFNPKAFRSLLTLGLLALLLAELVVYILLQQSADLGELPHYIADVLIIGISSLEFLLAPLICWLGTHRRRSTLVSWTLAGLVCTLPLFALPSPDIVRDAGLCAVVAPLSSSTSISAKAAVRLSLLVVCGLVCALARAALMAHGLAYIDEYTPSDNLHMHVGVILLHRVMVYILGGSMKSMIVDTPWLQMLIISIKMLIILVGLFRYPEVAPRVSKAHGSDRGLFRSLARVLGSGVAILQIFAMALLAAAWWGFGVHEAAFVQVKYHVRPDSDSQTGMIVMNIRTMSIVLGVILAGYIYTTPVMPKFDRKAAVASAARMCFLAALMYVLMTAALSCHRERIAGLGELAYSQPACGQNCRCDRPWMEFTPVCVPEQMTTYFSPCHAGCATTESVNGIGTYSNCTCGTGGRVTIGACDDGSCAGLYSFHQMLFVVVSLTSTLALVWQTTVVLESVDKRDVAMAAGFASGVVSLVAFGGAHGFYMGISSFTCAFTTGSKCLLQNNQFVPWVGYSSAILAGLAFIFSIISCIILRRQKGPKEEDLTL